MASCFDTSSEDEWTELVDRIKNRIRKSATKKASAGARVAGDSSNGICDALEQLDLLEPISPSKPTGKLLIGKIKDIFKDTAMSVVDGDSSPRSEPAEESVFFFSNKKKKPIIFESDDDDDSVGSPQNSSGSSHSQVGNMTANFEDMAISVVDNSSSLKSETVEESLGSSVENSAGSSDSIASLETSGMKESFKISPNVNTCSRTSRRSICIKEPGKTDRLVFSSDEEWELMLSTKKKSRKKVIAKVQMQTNATLTPGPAPTKNSTETGDKTKDIYNESANSEADSSSSPKIEPADESVFFFSNRKKKPIIIESDDDEDSVRSSQNSSDSQTVGKINDTFEDLAIEVVSSSSSPGSEPTEESLESQADSSGSFDSIHSPETSATNKPFVISPNVNTCSRSSRKSNCSNELGKKDGQVSSFDLESWLIQSAMATANVQTQREASLTPTFTPIKNVTETECKKNDTDNSFSVDSDSRPEMEDAENLRTPPISSRSSDSFEYRKTSTKKKPCVISSGSDASSQSNTSDEPYKSPVRRQSSIKKNSFVISSMVNTTSRKQRKSLCINEPGKTARLIFSSDDERDLVLSAKKNKTTSTPTLALAKNSVEKVKLEVDRPCPEVPCSSPPRLNVSDPWLKLVSPTRRANKQVVLPPKSISPPQVKKPLTSNTSSNITPKKRVPTSSSKSTKKSKALDPQNLLTKLGIDVDLNEMPSDKLVSSNKLLNAIFLVLDKEMFYSQLSENYVEVAWSGRLTSSAGMTHSKRKLLMVECDIKLSRPILKLRPAKDMMETLIHEMIHAYLAINRSRDYMSHGADFRYNMQRIKNSTGFEITVFHNFHDEVDVYRNRNVWRCDGVCRSQREFEYGYVRRAVDRAPGPHDFFWKKHAAACDGKFIKTIDHPFK